MNPDNFKLSVDQKTDVRDYQFFDDFKPFNRRYNKVNKTFSEYKNKTLSDFYSKYRINLLEFKFFGEKNKLVNKYTNFEEYLYSCWYENVSIDKIYSDVSKIYEF